MNKINIVEKMLDKEIQDYSIGKRCWKKDGAPGPVPYELSVSRKGVMKLIRRASAAAAEKGVYLPNNIPGWITWTVLKKENPMEEAARAAGWIEEISSFWPLKRVMQAPRVTLDVTKAMEFSPGALSRRILSIKTRADAILDSFNGYRASWKSVGEVAVEGRGSIGKCAVIAAAGTLQDMIDNGYSRSVRSYKEAREYLTLAGPLLRIKERMKILGEVNGNYDHRPWIGLEETLHVSLRAIAKECRLLGMETQHDYVAMAKLFKVYGSSLKEIKGFIAAIAKKGYGIRGVMQSFPATGTEEQLEWLFKNLKGERTPDVLIAVIKRWEDLLAEGWNPNASGSFEKAENILTSFQFVGATNIELAKVAGLAGFNPEKYREFESKWTARKAAKSSLFSPSIEQDGYKIRMLDKDDPRGVFIGIYTSCCQYIGGVGEGAAWESHTREDAGVWVVEQGEKIVAQSFVWTTDDKKSLVLDNIEGLFNREAKEIVETLFRKAATAAKQELGLEAVWQGISHNKAVAATDTIVERLQSKLPSYSDASFGVYRVV